jgi:hypothetical protein
MEVCGYLCGSGISGNFNRAISVDVGKEHELERKLALNQAGRLPEVIDRNTHAEELLVDQGDERVAFVGGQDRYKMHQYTK